MEYILLGMIAKLENALTLLRVLDKFGQQGVKD